MPTSRIVLGVANLVSSNRQTRCEAGTQNHGSVDSPAPDRQVTEGRVLRLNREDKGHVRVVSVCAELFEA
jgi:hypothetical protein